MRKPIRPFFVETRRGGRKPLAPKMNLVPEDEPAKASQTDWPPVPDEDESYGAAMRAADALFFRPQPAPDETSAEPAGASAASAPEPRRILPSLNEDDHIAQILAQEEQMQPRRGRKPRDPDELPPLRAIRARQTVDSAPVDEPAATVEQPYAKVVPGYVRGQIFARYARHDQARPGEQWRKRALKPLW